MPATQVTRARRRIRWTRSRPGSPKNVHIKISNKETAGAEIANARRVERGNLRSFFTRNRRRIMVPLLPTRIHGVMDYLMGVLLIAAPWLLGFSRGGAETWVPVLLGAGVLGY